MTDLSPIPVLWSNGVFAPATARQLQRCQSQFEEGKRYLIVEQQERSAATHSHYFANLNEAWMNLPEDIAHEFPTLEKFRATGLIATGFYDEKQVICASDDEARRVAAFRGAAHDMAIVSVHGCAVVARTPKSQSYRSMPKGEFQKSKEAVLGWAWALVGISPEEGAKNAGRAA